MCVCGGGRGGVCVYVWGGGVCVCVGGGGERSFVSQNL